MVARINPWPATAGYTQLCTHKGGSVVVGNKSDASLCHIMDSKTKKITVLTYNDLVAPKRRLLHLRHRFVLINSFFHGSCFVQHINALPSGSNYPSKCSHLWHLLMWVFCTRTLHNTSLQKTHVTYFISFISGIKSNQEYRNYVKKKKRYIC